MPVLTLLQNYITLLLACFATLSKRNVALNVSLVLSEINVKRIIKSCLLYVFHQFGNVKCLLLGLKITGFFCVFLSFFKKHLNAIMQFQLSKSLSYLA